MAVQNGTNGHASQNGLAVSEKELTIITPCGMMGYSYDYGRFVEACDTFGATHIISDSGSTDGGPLKLVNGGTTCPRESYVNDWEPILYVAHKRGIPVLIGSAGGDGANAHVDMFREIVEEISTRNGYKFKVATIYAEIPPDFVVKAVKDGQITPCGPVPELTTDEVRASTRIVAQMGAEPFIKALDEGAQIIIAGRAYDPAPYAAVCLREGIDAGIAWHMGKICECGAFCALPKGRTIVAKVRKHSFDLEPTVPNERCTPLSVAAHTFYEKSNPIKLVGPGGILDLSESNYEPLSDRKVRVTGAIFHPMPYTVKLEGARAQGFSTMFLGGIRDPILISQLDSILERVKGYASSAVGGFDEPNEQLVWRVYGKNGVMGPLETQTKTVSHEVGIVGQALAATQARATRIANLARVGLLHVPYAGQLSTGGNFASPILPLELPLGPSSSFNIYHITPTDPYSLFLIKYSETAFSITQPANGSVIEFPKNEGMMDARKFTPTDKPSFEDLIGSGQQAVPLAALASVIRSKNAGPFEITLDVMFDNPKAYYWVKQSGVLNLKDISGLYNIKPDQATACLFFDRALGFKFTFPRTRAQGSFGETDMHGSQQAVPLTSLLIQMP